MTAQEALRELLARVNAAKGEAVFITDEELGSWPVEVVRVLKHHKFLVKAAPAESVVCPGCEQDCVMPVHIQGVESDQPQSFVVCDKRSDISRVQVPFSRIEQWQSSCTAIAGMLAARLGLDTLALCAESSGRWEIGVFRSAKSSSHLTLVAGDGLALKLSGHTVELANILTIEDSDIKIDKKALMRLVDKPVAGGGDAESAEQRRSRLRNWVAAEKKAGNRAFQKSAAEREGISVQRLKQILEEKPSKIALRSKRSEFR